MFVCIVRNPADNNGEIRYNLGIPCSDFQSVDKDGKIKTRVQDASYQNPTYKVIRLSITTSDLIQWRRDKEKEFGSPMKQADIESFMRMNRVAQTDIDSFLKPNNEAAPNLSSYSSIIQTTLHTGNNKAAALLIVEQVPSRIAPEKQEESKPPNKTQHKVLGSQAPQCANPLPTYSEKSEQEVQKRLELIEAEVERAISAARLKLKSEENPQDEASWTYNP